MIETLIVSSNEKAADRVRRFFAKRGGYVRSETSLDEAREAAREKPFALIFLDGGLVGSDAQVLSQEIRSLKEPADSYLVLLADSADADLFEGLLESGIDDYLIKSPRGGVFARRLLVIEKQARQKRELQRSQQALKEFEEKYVNLLDLTNEGVCIVRNQQFQVVNRHFAEMMGFMVDEMIGTSFTNYVHEEHLPELAGAYERHLSGERDLGVFEILAHRKDGSLISVEVRSGIVSEEGDKSELVFVRDVTERRKAEEERERLATAMEQFPEGVIITDPQGLVQYVNPAFTRLTGNALQDVRGKVPALEADQSEEEYARELARALAEGQARTPGLFRAGKGDQPAALESTISPMKSKDGRLLGFLILQIRSRNVARRDIPGGSGRRRRG